MSDSQSFDNAMDEVAADGWLEPREAVMLGLDPSLEGYLERGTDGTYFLIPRPSAVQNKFLPQLRPTSPFVMRGPAWQRRMVVLPRRGPISIWQMQLAIKRFASTPFLPKPILDLKKGLITVAPPRQARPQPSLARKAPQTMAPRFIAKVDAERPTMAVRPKKIRNDLSPGMGGETDCGDE